MTQSGSRDIFNYRLWSFLIVFFGACSRIWGAGADSFWLDEVLTLRTVHGGWTVALGLKDHPPLMYWISTGITNLTVESELTLRFVSVIGGIIAIPLIIELGRFFLDRATGLLAGMLLAVSSFHLRYAHEARHYALMMALTLAATYFMCRGLSRSRSKHAYFWWIGFAIASALSMYTHYAACLVFATHCSVIGFVWIKRWYKSRAVEIWPLIAVGLAGLLYVPWLFQLYQSIAKNLQTAGTFQQERVVDVTGWPVQTALSFGYSNTAIAITMVILLFAGLGCLWAFNKRFQAFVFASIIFVPFGIIIGLQVARAPIPKYVIFMLPAFLLSISYAISTVIRLGTAGYQNRQRLILAGMGLVILTFGGGAIQAEYVRQERGWGEALEAWEAAAADGDVIISLNLDLANGFNQGLVVAPLYLSEGNETIDIIDGNFLRPETIEELPPDGNLWGLIIDRHPPYPDQAKNLNVQKFQGDLYLVNLKDQSTSPFEQLGQLMNTFVTLTTPPTPVCLVHQNLAAHHFVASEYEQVLAEFEIANSLCPTPPRDGSAWNELETQTQYLLLDQYLVGGDEPAVQQIAFDLLLKDQKDQKALEALTYFDVLNAYQIQSEQVTVQNFSEPNPIDVRRFTMPQNGDWGDAIFLHPPNEITISLELPNRPTSFVSRLAMAPESWDWGGDGAVFIVEAAVDGGQSDIIFQQQIDNQPENRRWHDVSVPLEQYSGQSVSLTLRTEIGSNQNDVGDWAGWESPRIIFAAPTEE
ncbi:MAG: glycosyltransferase family 39 protein [Chloroflexota bacterium]